MIRFIIPDLFIYSRHAEEVAPPRLEEYMLDWLEECGITEWDLVWVERGPMSNSSFTPRIQGQIIWDTGICFFNDQQAMMFKLRWAGLL